MNTENVADKHNGLLFSLSFMATWINLENILNKIYQAEKDKYCITSLMVDSNKVKITGAERTVVTRG